MSTVAPDPTPLVGAGARRGLRAPWRRPDLVFAAVAAAAVIAAALLTARSREPALRGLSPERRAAALAHTVEDLRQLCGEGHTPELDDHCRELASFAARFDECRGECAELVRGLRTPIPTR